MSRVYTGSTLPKGWSATVPGHRHSDGYRSRTFYSYFNMITRCYYPSTPYYHIYGGRGILVSRDWVKGRDDLNGFQIFLLDMGIRPRGRTLDRIDPDGSYTIDNCKWSTLSEQNTNRRRWTHEYKR